jgi:hypothetical protein
VPKSLPVCAAAAHGGNDSLPGKSRPDRGGAGTSQDFSQGRMVNISQRDIAFGIPDSTAPTGSGVLFICTFLKNTGQ